MTNTNRISNAALFYDAQDPQCHGWVLRYDVDGSETSDPIDGDRDDSVEDLAPRVASSLAVYEERIDVKTGEAHGRITVEAGTVIGWRAL